MTRIALLCALFAALLIPGQRLPAWGGLGHTLISDAAVDNLPAEMFDDGSGNAFSDWRDFLRDHASLPDALKDHDDLESHRHWIDLDQDGIFSPPFEDFPRELETYLTIFDRSNGTNAWEGVRDHHDALVQAFRMRNWHAVYRCAADLGHYIADSTSPFHSTANYNGQLTGNDGIHSRHESGLLNRHITFEDLTTQRSGAGALREQDFVDDPVEFGLQTLIQGFAQVDLILLADTAASLVDPGHGEIYYSLMFESVGELTIDQLNDGGERLANIWHTAWIEAGSPGFGEGPILRAAPATEITVDGDLSEFPGNAEEQTNTTDLGDNVCELDQLFMARAGEDLCIGIAGNLAPDHAITLLLDTVPGGAGTLSIPAVLAHLQAINGSAVSPGFSPDHLVTVMRTETGLDALHLNLSTSVVTSLGSSASLHLALIGGGEAALDDSNTVGVTERNGQQIRASGEVRTGLELRLPESLLGSGGSGQSTVGAVVLLTSSAFGAPLSNQTLPGMPFGEYGSDHHFPRTSLADIGFAAFALVSETTQQGLQIH